MRGDRTGLGRRHRGGRDLEQCRGPTCRGLRRPSARRRRAPPTSTRSSPPTMLAVWPERRLSARVRPARRSHALAVPGRLRRRRRRPVDDGFAHNAALIQTGELLRAAADVGWSRHVMARLVGRGGARPVVLAARCGGRSGRQLCGCSSPKSAIPTGAGAATGAEPVATWRARYRLPDLELLDMEQAADSSSSLYGYSIVSDNDWTYLLRPLLSAVRAGRGVRVRSVVLAARLPRSCSEGPARSAPLLLDGHGLVACAAGP